VQFRSPYLIKTFDQLEVSARGQRVLDHIRKHAYMNPVGDLITLTEDELIEHIYASKGQKSSSFYRKELDEMKDLLANMGLALADG